MAFFSFFDDLLFPATCVLCKKDGAIVCELCRSRLPLAPMRCPFCDRMSDNGNTCEHCRKQKKLDGAISLWSYDDKRVKKIIETIKFLGLFGALDCLSSELLNIFLRAFAFQDGCVLVPVPQSRKSFVERGYNQAEFIARTIAKASGVPLVSALSSNAKGMQHKKTVSERWLHVDERFSSTRLAKGIHHAIVVDDLLTTGATLEACARALKNAGALQVYGLTVARQPKILERWPSG